MSITTTTSEEHMGNRPVIDDDTLDSLMARVEAVVPRDRNHVEQGERYGHVVCIKPSASLYPPRLGEHVRLLWTLRDGSLTRAATYGRPGLAKHQEQ